MEIIKGQAKKYLEEAKGEIVRIYIESFSPVVAPNYKNYGPILSLDATNAVIAKILEVDDQTVTIAADTIYDFGVAKFTVELDRVTAIDVATEEDIENVFGDFNSIVEEPQYVDRFNLSIVTKADNDDFGNLLPEQQFMFGITTDAFKGEPKHYEYYSGITAAEAIEKLKSFYDQDVEIRWQCKSRSFIYDYLSDEKYEVTSAKKDIF